MIPRLLPPNAKVYLPFSLLVGISAELLKALGKCCNSRGTLLLHVYGAAEFLEVNVAVDLALKEVATYTKQLPSLKSRINFFKEACTLYRTKRSCGGLLAVLLRTIAIELMQILDEPTHDKWHGLAMYLFDNDLIDDLANVSCKGNLGSP